MVALINKFKLKIVGIVESRVNESNFNKVWFCLSNKLQNWDICTNYACSYMARIWVIYNKDCLNVWKDLTISFIYGSYISSERVELWDNLKNLADNVDCSWMVVCDFNAVMNDTNRIGGNAIDVQAAEEFMDCIRCCNIIEMRRTRNNNNQIGEERIWKKLDWCFVNDKWPDAFVNVLSPGVSDHSPMVVNLDNCSHIRKSPFRFFNVWSEDSKFNSIVNRGWNRASSGCKMFRIVQKLKWLKSDSRELNKEEWVCSKYLLKLMAWEENILRQKSRMNWIKLGDQNNKFFHKSVKMRQSRLKIINLKLSNGENSGDIDVIKVDILNHFKRFLGTKNEMGANFKYEVLRDGPIITEEESSSMTIPVSNDEIKRSLFLINDEKAPGPDGLVRVISRLISQTQSAFVPGRSISNNILLAHEIIGDYHRKDNNSRAIKVDIQKAYDYVSWDFIEEILIGLNFPYKFISLVMSCIRTSIFSIMINGDYVGYFRGGKGLRSLSRNTKPHSNFVFHKSFKVIKLNHLCFADDLFIFSGDDDNSIRIIKESISLFSETSGLLPELSKSSVYFNGANNDRNNTILNILGFHEVTSLSDILGSLLCPPSLLKTIAIPSFLESLLGSLFGPLSRCPMLVGCKNICRNFIWHGSNSDKRRGLVKWEKKPSIWATWVNANKLKRLSFLGVTKLNDCSSSWRQILNIRPKVKILFDYKLGNGRKFFFWFDPWLDGKSIIERFPDLTFKDADVAKNAKVYHL
ncbi:uncharacterized protein LOC126666115 [Mercurialis annua]|uniref:uncharacterized protein LOC126666115 n=1 Tax=Mercurialis annua TaxID=3986 RepID=UPI00215E8822|nr:uncharacterized protein LOC126666115 [Mercurialis annua]